MNAAEREKWRLLPGEEPVWEGAQEPGVPRDGWLRYLPVLPLSFAVVSALFALLLFLESLPGSYRTLATAVAFVALAILALLLPRHLLDGRAYLVTDRRVLSRRGRSVRSMDRVDVTLGRIRWHAGVPGVGDLEIVVAVPFGPLARRLRIVFRTVRAPDRVFSIIRGRASSEGVGDPDLRLVDRLDVGEEIHWGGHPEGWLFGWREILIGVGGLLLTSMGVAYGVRTGSILLRLEENGLAIGSVEWFLLVLAVTISGLVFVGLGLGAIWYGPIRARELGHETEYILTERRLLIRRGRTELSVDRRRIVDVAELPARGGHRHLFLVLDAPGSRALAVSGALAPILPAREGVPPILFDLDEPGPLVELLLGATEGDVT